MNELASEHQPSNLQRAAALLEWMERQGLGYGARFAVSDMETTTMSKRDTAKFARIVMAVSAELVSRGFVLSQAGDNKLSYHIVPVEGNAKAMERWRRERVNSARRSVILASATPRDQLSEIDRKRLEHAAELAAVDSILLKHAREAHRLFQNSRPKARLRE